MQEKDKKQNSPIPPENIVEFIDVVNYQMREPITSIFASLPIMAENINQNNTQAALENLDVVYKRTYSIIKSVNNLTVVSKLKSGYEYSKNVIDFSKLVKNAFQSSQMVLPADVSIECSIENGCLIKGNNSLLTVALFNILLNSLEYRKEDVNVLVKLKKEKDRCILTYRDNSKGIKADVIGSVFEPFYSVDPYNDGEITTKLGVGLYIVKQAVNYAGGTIIIQSEFGEGVNINISIPLCDDTEETVFESKSSDFLLNKYSEMFVQLCEYCQLPDLI